MEATGQCGCRQGWGWGAEAAATPEPVEVWALLYVGGLPHPRK